VSKCLMYLRSPWHRSLLWLDQQASDSAQETPRNELPDSQLDAGQRLDLEAALDQLSPRARAVVWLHDVEGYTHDEIADLYGKTVSFSKSQLMRAHSRLRQLLDERHEETTCTSLSTSY
jgi:RNA polymerase sigma factor (sigma-70 family)